MPSCIPYAKLDCRSSLTTSYVKVDCTRPWLSTGRAALPRPAVQPAGVPRAAGEGGIPGVAGEARTARQRLFYDK
jgi:hypothetical protein